MTAVLNDPAHAGDAATLQEAARQRYKDAINQGQKLVGRDLGRLFGRSERWGRDRIAEVERSATPIAAPAPPPAEPVRRRRITRRGRRAGRPARFSRQVRARDGQAEAQEPPATEEATEQSPLPVDVPAGHTAPKPVTRGTKVIIWLAFLAGITVSIAANMLDARIDGTPGGRAELVGAAFWPIALLLALEVLIRAPWPRGFWWWGAARYLGLGVVALAAFFLSYRHMSGLLASWGEDWWNSHLGPLAADGLMLIAAAALLAISRTKKEPPRPTEAP